MVPLSPWERVAEVRGRVRAQREPPACPLIPSPGAWPRGREDKKCFSLSPWERVAVGRRTASPLTTDWRLISLGSPLATGHLPPPFFGARHWPLFVLASPLATDHSPLFLSPLATGHLPPPFFGARHWPLFVLASPLFSLGSPLATDHSPPPFLGLAARHYSCWPSHLPLITRHCSYRHLPLVCPCYSPSSHFPLSFRARYLPLYSFWGSIALPATSRLALSWRQFPNQSGLPFRSIVLT
jgi:hypothetical protein